MLSALILSCAWVERRQVFILFKAEKLLSAEAVLLGIVRMSLANLNTSLNAEVKEF